MHYISDSKNIPLIRTVWPWCSTALWVPLLRSSLVKQQPPWSVTTIAWVWTPLDLIFQVTFDSPYQLMFLGPVTVLNALFKISTTNIDGFQINTELRRLSKRSVYVAVCLIWHQLIFVLLKMSRLGCTGLSLQISYSYSGFRPFSFCPVHRRLSEANKMI